MSHFTCVYVRAQAAQRCAYGAVDCTDGRRPRCCHWKPRGGVSAEAVDGVRLFAVAVAAGQVVSLLKENEGTDKERVCGARVKDTLSGDEWSISARVVINATGPFSDRYVCMCARSSGDVCDAAVYDTWRMTRCPTSLLDRVVFISCFRPTSAPAIWVRWAWFCFASPDWPAAVQV